MYTPGEVYNIDCSVSMQYSAGKPWVLANEHPGTRRQILMHGDPFESSGSQSGSLNGSNSFWQVPQMLNSIGTQWIWRQGWCLVLFVIALLLLSVLLHWEVVLGLHPCLGDIYLNARAQDTFTEIRWLMLFSLPVGPFSVAASLHIELNTHKQGHMGVCIYVLPQRCLSDSRWLFERKNKVLQMGEWIYTPKLWPVWFTAVLLPSLRCV